MKNLILALTLTTSSFTSAFTFGVLSNTFTSTQNIGGNQYQPATNPFSSPFFGDYSAGIENFGSQAAQVPQGGNRGQFKGPQQGFNELSKTYFSFGDSS